MRTVHQVIDTNHDEILRRWLVGVGRSAFAEDLTPDELSGLMPDYLGSLGGETASDPSQMNEAQGALLERHLSNRLRQGSTLNEILAEFSVLSRCLAEVIELESPAAQPTARDAARVFTEIHHACVASIRIFNEHLLEDEQTLKRYLRHLQRITDDGEDLRGGDPSRTRVEKALSLIMQAMAADTVALLLFDPSTNTLVMSASAGEADEAVEHYVTSLAPTSLGGMIAANDRGSGIHSLLGVRLSSRHTLRGVLYVGVRARRSFAPGEIRLLESLGEALTIHLDHARMCAALRVKAAEAAADSDLRDRFVSILMHDLSAPLAAARAGAAALDAPHLVDELDRAADMVAGLVDAHRIRSGQPMPMTVGRFDLSALVHETVADLRELHGDRFVLDVDSEVTGVWSRAQLRRALWNLVSNAIRFGSAGDPVSLSLRRTSEGVELSVHNDGGEIPAEERAELFRPFSTPRSGRGHPPGWGLGLTLVWGCAEAHGGRVEVTSAESEGTTFTMLLPYDARPYAG
jgi:signal transduction histidine kinase